MTKILWFLFDSILDIVAWIVQRIYLMTNRRNAKTFTHGLNKPKGETKHERADRFALEFARQEGYSDALKGGYNNKHMYQDAYDLGADKGKADYPNYLRGHTDAVNNRPQNDHNHAYAIGYSHGMADERYLKRRK